MLAAAVQMTSREDVAANLESAGRLIATARARGAELVVLPENFALLSPDDKAKLGHAESLDGHAPGPIASFLMSAARAHGVWLVGGGMPERGPDDKHVYNTCVVVSPEGAIVSRYRKIHLFDVTTSDGVTYRESEGVAPGSAPVVAATPWGGLGLSVCYDLRFPELYRALSAGGARMLVVPAAFTVPTGRDHWHVLLRARAVENQAFVIAAAQWGQHHAKRATYGHTLIVDPWGTVLAECPDGEGLAIAELDLARQDEIRQSLPALTHRRM